MAGTGQCLQDRTIRGHCRRAKLTRDKKKATTNRFPASDLGVSYELRSSSAPPPHRPRFLLLPLVTRCVSHEDEPAGLHEAAALPWRAHHIDSKEGGDWRESLACGRPPGA